MKEIFIKDKNAQHTLKIDGKEVIFVNGKATVMDEDAKKIKAGSEYVIKDVIPPKDDFKPAKVEITEDIVQEPEDTIGEEAELKIEDEEDVKKMDLKKMEAIPSKKV